MVRHEEKWAIVDDEAIWTQSGSLRDFSALKHLSIGVVVFFCLARGTESMDTDDPNQVTPFDQVVIADALPASLESLCLRGYQKNLRDDFDKVIALFVAERETKLPNLKKVTGIEEWIYFAFSLNSNNPGDEHLLWKREEEDWTEYEF